MSIGMVNFEFKMADVAERSLVEAYLVQMIISHDDWILDHQVLHTDGGSFIRIMYWNGRDEVWHRLRNGDTIIFFGEAESGIPGIVATQPVMQITTAPQQLMAEAAISAIMGDIGMPGPTQMFSELTDRMESGDFDDTPMPGDVGFEIDDIFKLIKDIIERPTEGDND